MPDTIAMIHAPTDTARMRNPRSNRYAVSALALLLVALLSRVGRADLIDFESYAHYSDGQDFSETVVTSTNSLQISLSADALPRIGRVGESNKAFAPLGTPRAVDGTPYTDAGAIFLTDQSGGYWSDFHFDFESPVTGLSLDIYDFRPDGGGVLGESRVMLSGFTDSALSSALDSDAYVSAWIPDGGVISLSVRPGDSFSTAVLAFSGPRDVGIGIDNIEFTTAPEPVPEPATLITATAGALAAWGARRRRSRSGRSTV